MAVYKTITLAQAHDREVTNLSASDETKVKETISQFVTFFKAANV